MSLTLFFNFASCEPLDSYQIHEPDFWCDIVLLYACITLNNNNIIRHTTISIRDTITIDVINKHIWTRTAIIITDIFMWNWQSVGRLIMAIYTYTISSILFGYYFAFCKIYVTGIITVHDGTCHVACTSVFSTVSLFVSELVTRPALYLWFIEICFCVVVV